MNEHKRKLFMQLEAQLGKTYPTMRRYIDHGTYTAEVCLNAERITKGEITAVELRPDLFKPNHAQVTLANDIVDNYEQLLNNTNNYIMIATTLNYIETQCPELYTNVIEEMSKTEVGVTFIKQRNSHRIT